MSDYVNHNPDILTCLANLSNDEVFTPPELANQVLDLIPEDFWKDPNVKVLDPACKSGVFLRECAKRFLKGLEPEIPNLQERIDHIFQKQLFGYAITELTAFVTRRSLYCSKLADGPYSVSKFSRDWGNINYKRVEHLWKGDSCALCGAPKSVYKRGTEQENYAYRFIHLSEIKQKELLNMKFDLIISNPPYQIGDDGNGASASPLYHLFVEQAMKLKPRYLVMIIPARWYAGGKGLDAFRGHMLEQSHIRELVDYPNSADCFPGVNVAGGICYFLWDYFYRGDCHVSNMKGGMLLSEMARPLGEYPYFVRNNMALEIIRKVLASGEALMSNSVFSRNYFGIPTTITGKKRPFEDSIRVLTSKGDLYIEKNTIIDKANLLGRYKVVVTYAMSGGNKPTSDGNYQVLSSLIVLKPNEVCSETYLILDTFTSEKEAKNLVKYMAGKFSRFLLLQALTSIHITKDKFCFVPLQDFSETWTDKKLYEKYQLSETEIAYIESTIKSIELEYSDD